MNTNIDAGSPGSRPLADWGLGAVPLLEPLAYPGRPAPGPAVLLGDGLTVLQRWDGAAVDGLLAEAGAPPLAARTPVLAVGSNAAPAQLHHKLAALPPAARAVPLCPVRADGLGVGVSAHISRAGYISAAPFAAPGARAALTATWLDPEQLAAVDATELTYRRRPARGPVALPDGTALDGAFLYVHRTGVLAAEGDGDVPLPAGPQPELLAGLLARSARLRALFDHPGSPAEFSRPSPTTALAVKRSALAFVTRAAADPQLRTLAADLFQELGWVLPQPDLHA
ncbi:hypothetical protein BIV57_04710 [Mangrovactinospora gilvigrisea]|uniref:Uncharacterized protein n=1 Tax=Mangrovactinospora gilvigrisea TaxID=1428644 RepID=A0A1J7BIR5_9ACTN|nr:hypothetical protein [Mangrovactinospora gilvigrisea]OIV38563.1 hypothetical protein BIV57_04710 [Mangrovactinospora gilvigrisea]